MKKSILLGCLLLGLAGCATERGGVGTAYDTTYGTGWGTSQSMTVRDSIYPVRRDPSITGNDIGSVRPLIDPSRQYDLDYGPRSEISTVTVEREYPPRATAPRDPFVR